jgi:hypothetical protein
VRQIVLQSSRLGDKRGWKAAGCRRNSQLTESGSKWRARVGSVLCRQAHLCATASPAHSASAVTQMQFACGAVLGGPPITLAPRCDCVPLLGMAGTNDARPQTRLLGADGEGPFTCSAAVLRMPDRALGRS